MGRVHGEFYPDLPERNTHTSLELHST